MKLIKKFTILSLMIMILAGCASYRPVVDENEKYKKVGEERVEKDIDACMAKADAYLEKHKAESMKKEAGRGAVKGAILGTVVGALSGGDLKSAAVGAGAGAVVGGGAGAAGVAAKDNLTPDQMKQNYVSQCLQRMGYSVIGWK